MVLIVDFDKTFYKNDFFIELVLMKLIVNPFFIFKLLNLNSHKIVKLKIELFEENKINYDTKFLLNKKVYDWIVINKKNYSKVVLVSATPQFVLQSLLNSYNIFDEIYGTTTVNLKGEKKLEFIRNKFNEDFHYVGDSISDKIIFKNAKKSYLVKYGGINEIC